MTSNRQINLISAVPTLFDTAGEVDLGAVKAAYDWLAGHDVDGVFVAGTTGEFTTLEDDERLDVCAVASEAFGADRTYWHVGGASAHQAVRLTAAAVARGATRLAALTPYYFPATESAVLGYYEHVVRAAGDVPVFAYLFEARTTTVVSPELLARIAGTGIAGVKISGQPHPEVRRYVETLRRDALPVYSGADGEFSEVVALGGAGVVSGVSSVLPEPFLKVRDALRTGDESALSDAQDLARRAIDATNQGDLVHLKAVLTLRGLPASGTRAAFDPLTPQARRELEAAVRDLL